MPLLPHNGYLALGQESAWGTAEVTTMEFMEIVSESIKVAHGEKVLAGINSSRTHRKRVRLGKTVGGDLSFEVNPEDGIGILLKHLLPTEETNDEGSGNGGVHGFTPGVLLPEGVTAQVFRPESADGTGSDGSVWNYTGGRVRQLQFSAAQEDVLQCVAGMSFRDHAYGTQQVPTYTAQKPFVYHTGTLALDLEESLPIESFQLTIASGLKDGRRRLGSNLIMEQVPGMYEVSGQIVVSLDEPWLVQKFLDDEPASISLELTGEDVGTTTRRIELFVPVAYFNGDTPTLAGRDDESKITIPFRGVQDGTNPALDEVVQVILANSRRTAY